MKRRTRTWLGVAGALLLLVLPALVVNWPSAHAQRPADPILDLGDLGVVGGANINTSTLVPITPGTAWRITVTVDTATTFELLQTRTTAAGTTPLTSRFNAGSTLTPNAKHTFTTGVSRSSSYFFRCGTTCRITELLVEAVRDGAL